MTGISPHSARQRASLLRLPRLPEPV